MSEPTDNEGSGGDGWLAGLLAALIGVPALIGGCCAGSTGLLALAAGGSVALGSWLAGGGWALVLGVTALAGALWRWRRMARRCGNAMSDNETRTFNQGNT